MLCDLMTQPTFGGRQKRMLQHFIRSVSANVLIKGSPTQVSDIHCAKTRVLNIVGNI